MYLFFFGLKWVYNLIGSRKFNALLRELYSWSRIHIYGPLEYLNSWAFEHQNIWISKHLNTKILEHSSMLTVKYNPIWTMVLFWVFLVIFFLCVYCSVLFTLNKSSFHLLEHLNITMFKHFYNPQILGHWTQSCCNARHHIGNAKCALQRESGLRTCRSWEGGLKGMVGMVGVPLPKLIRHKTPHSSGGPPWLPWTT